MKIQLYVKTHNVTGKKYFGKTTRNDIHEYQGSGVAWRRHLDEYGYDVMTEVIKECNSVDEAADFALSFSETNDIVNSTEWLNTIPECVTHKDNFKYVNSQGLNRPDTWSKESRERHRQSSIKKGNQSAALKTGIHAQTPEQRSENSRKGSQKSQEACMEKYGVKSYFSIANTDPGLIEKKKKIFKDIGHQQGCKNSQYGSCWIKNATLEMNKRISKDDLDSYVEQGWTKGRVMGWPSHK